MSTSENGIVLELLPLIERNNYQLALRVWFDYRHSNPELCQHCPYKDSLHKPDDCCQCLEAKLRTLSLYQHDGGTYEDSLVGAARKLSRFHSQLPA